MVVIFNSVQDLSNSMVKINSSWIKEVSNSKLNKFPISCCYYLTLFDISNDDEINDLFTYINDKTRTIEYPFTKDNQTNYSLMLEPEQFYNINLNNNTNTNIKDVSRNIDNFLNIVNESDGKIIFVLDISYLLNFMVELKKKSIPNHLIDMILYKLTNSTKISEIYILDKQSIITNTSNLFFIQLEMCMGKNISEMNEKKIVVYKDVNESLIENVYWYVLEPEIKITEFIGKVQSPYDNTYFNLMKIGEKKYFVRQINISECVDKNLYTLNDNPGIIIHPVDRLFV
jgi:hypothetical protein